MQLYPSLITRLETQHETISHILANTRDAQVFMRPEPGKWNIHENIAHLARYQVIFIERIKEMLGNNEPAFERYVAENDPEFEQWKPMNPDILLKRLNQDRKIIYDMIIRLPEPSLQKTGTHPRFGRLTISQWTEFFLLHEAHHLFTIFKLAGETTVAKYE
jgi:hypothetical protein